MSESAGELTASADEELSIADEPNAASELSAADEPNATSELNAADEPNAASELSAADVPNAASELSAAYESNTAEELSAVSALDAASEPSAVDEPSAAEELSAVGALDAADEQSEAQAGVRVLPERRQVWRDFFVLAWPSAVELTLASTLSMITMALVSPLGKEAVSAVGITGQPVMIPQIVIQAFAVGGTAMVSRAYGRHDTETMRVASEQSMLLAFLFSIIMGIVMYVFGGALILWMGATEDYYYLAEMYMKYCAIGGIFQYISTSIAALLRGIGKNRISMQFSVTTNVVNVVVGYALIHGLGPIPAMGLRGAAIAQLAGKFCGCVFALYILFFSKDQPIKPTINGMLNIRPDIIVRVSNVGLSAAIEQIAMRVGMITFTILVIQLGTADYAAHNIAGTVHTYVINFGAAVSYALVSLIGNNLGRNRADIAEMYFAEAIKLCFIMSGILMIPLLSVPKYIAWLFTEEEDVVRSIVIALRILACFTPSQILQIAIAGGLRGGGDTRWPLYMTMIGILGVRMVVGYFFLVVFKWGIAGAWWCWCIDQTSRAVFIYFRFKGGKWKTVRV